jgi:hypothetical protein
LNEVRANAAPPRGADGFVPASLLSIFAFEGSFLHNTGGVDTLSNASDRARVVQFLRSIDAATPPIPF